MTTSKILALFCVPVVLAGVRSLPTPVADAAMHGDADSVRKLLLHGANVNAAQGDGMTALHWAAERGDARLTTTLLAAHASVRAVTRIGAYTPLHIAAKSGNTDVVTALVKAGADVNAVTSTGATALHFAAAAGNPDVVSVLLDHGANANARESEWGQTPLVFAAEYNRASAIRVLLERGADPSLHTTMVNLTEEAARDQAATRKRNEVLISFEPKERRDSIAAAAPVAQSAVGAQSAAVPPATPAAPRTPRASVAATTPTSLDSAVGLAGARATAAAPAAGRGGRGAARVPKGPFTPTQVQLAIDSGREVLMRAPAPGTKVTEVVDTINGGVAGYAASVGGVGGLSALHHAVRQGNIEATLALLDGGANINDTSSVDRTTPLLLAAINGQFDVAMKLIQRGANVNIASTAGVTPLYATINTQWAPKSRFPQPQALQNQQATYLEVMAAMLKAGANPNVRVIQHPWYFAYNNCGNANCGLENLEGTTAFWRATYAVDVDAMRMLVANGADPNIPSQRAPQTGRGGRGGGGARGQGGGRGQAPPPPLEPAIDSAAKAAPVGVGVYPIHAAAGVGYGNGFAGNSHRHAPDGWMPAMRYLVEELHADVNARDATGYTPLHHAAARGDNEMILYLVSKGADPKAVSRNGRTTVDMANGPVQRLRPFPETIALLEKLGAKNQHHCVSC
ncbi:MAG TPA: ankyrin repeat domain-containing protein [Gemmatimonadaceae bacterium]